VADRRQLEQAIAAQEQLRGVVPDDVVDATIATLRETLSSLGKAPLSDRRRQATVLFADIAGFTALASTLDAEVIGDLMNDLWAELDGVVDRHGGWLDKHIGDALMAVWGAEHAREDDPERAVRAALDLITTFADFSESRELDLGIRVGVNTGPLLLGRVGTAGEVSAMGDTVNVASRLEQAAPVGGALVSHDTYRHVRGIFDAEGPELHELKGKAAPVAAYRIFRPKARAFRVTTRGVEGVETRMIGRDEQLERLQGAYDRVVGEGRAQLVTVVGEAGAGKSRLLYELVNWIELQPEAVIYFKGRAGPDLQAAPRGLLRELFAYRFDISDDDPRATVVEKLRWGLAPLDERAADVVGHWLGFDLAVSDAVQDLAGSPEFGSVAQAHLARYLRANTGGAPLVVLLEDVHWADPESLEAIEALLDAFHDTPLLVVAVMRPTTLDGPTALTGAEADAIRIELEPLSRDDSRALVEEIMQRIDRVPATLVDVVVDRAEGNPFFVEELVKVLIEGGVIETPDDGAWRVVTDRVADVALPSTLNGVMQARVDGLSEPERFTLQHASVVGRIFWDDAVAALSATTDATEGRPSVPPTFAALCVRGLVHSRARSVFAGSEEFVFHHALLRDTMYETVLLRDRARLHAATARWLEERSADRMDEHLALIAEHLARGGELQRAADLFARSAERSFLTGAVRSANLAFERALELRAAAGAPATRDTLAAANRLGETSRTLGQLQRADEVLRLALAEARAMDEPREAVKALDTLTALAIDRGDFDQAGALIDDALALAEPAGGPAVRTRLNQTDLALRQGKTEDAKAYAERALEQATALDDPLLVFASLNSLATVMRDDLDGSEGHLTSALELARRLGNLEREAVVLTNLGVISHLRADGADAENSARHYAEAIDRYCESQALYADLGLHEAAAQVLVNLAQAEIEVGQSDAARRHAIDSLALNVRAGADSRVLFVLLVCAQIAIEDGHPERGLELIGLVRSDFRCSHDDLGEIDRILAAYRTGATPEIADAPLGLTDDEVEAALAAGGRLDFDRVVAQLLEGQLT
jgi:class 3 adenylate cyclase/tetratricopeptide (TPR) repeat protein